MCLCIYMHGTYALVLAKVQVHMCFICISRVMGAWVCLYVCMYVHIRRSFMRNQADDEHRDEDRHCAEGEHREGD